MGLVYLKIVIPLAMLLGILIPVICARPLHESIFVNISVMYIFISLLVIIEAILFLSFFNLIEMILDSDKTVEESGVELRRFQKLFMLFQLSSIDPSITDIVPLTEERIKELLVIMSRHILLWEDRVKRYEGMGKEAPEAELKKVLEGLRFADVLLKTALNEQQWFGTAYTRKEVFAIADPPKQTPQ